MSEKNYRYSSQAEREGYYNPTITCLNAGVPGKEMRSALPMLMEKATIHRMKEEIVTGAELFQYGIEEGDYKFRQSLAKFLSEEYGEEVQSKNLFLTAGASSALWYLLTLLFKPGALVLVEDTTYFAAIKMFQDFGANIVPVGTDEEGIIPDNLVSKLDQYLPPDKVNFALPLRALLYLIPVFNNPSGRTMSKARCCEIVKIAADHGILVMCDDVYNLLHHNCIGLAPKRLFSFAKHNNVISSGSFSKILAPGLRLGWLEAPLWLVEKLMTCGLTNSGGGLNTYTSGIVSSLISMGLLGQHVQVVRDEYKRRMVTLKNALKLHLPEKCLLKSPCNGGYFLWIQLPQQIDAKIFQAFSKKEYQVNVFPGVYASVLNSHSNYIRLSVSMYTEEVLEAAAKRLCDAIIDFQGRLDNDPHFLKNYISYEQSDDI